MNRIDGRMNRGLHRVLCSGTGVTGMDYGLYQSTCHVSALGMLRYSSSDYCICSWSGVWTVRSTLTTFMSSHLPRSLTNECGRMQSFPRSLLAFETNPISLMGKSSQPLNEIKEIAHKFRICIFC